MVELAVLLFPAASENAPLETEIEPVPFCVFAVGVNTTVYDVPETAVNDDSVPPLNVMSPSTKSVEASDKVKVKVDVSPDFSVDAFAEIETVGTRVSYVKLVVELPELPLPAASVKKLLRTNA